MTTEEIIILGYILYPSGLFLLFFINLFYFIFKKPEERDQLFEYSEFNYNYDNIIQRMNGLKKFVGQDFAAAFSKINQYNENAKRTRRPFIKYMDRIEDGFVLLYAKKGGATPVKFLYEDLSRLIKFEVFYTTLFYPFVFIFMLTYISNDFIILKILMGSFYLLCIYAFWIAFTKLILTVKYGLIVLLFQVFKKPTGALRRNINLLDYLYNTSHFNMVMIKLMYVSFLVSLGIAKKTGTGFRGFKGGRFGGGGAGGSW